VITKIQLLLSASGEEQINQITDQLALEWARIKETSPDTRHRLAVRVPGDPTASVPQDGQPDEVPEQPSFDVVFELRGENLSFEGLSRSVEGIGERLGPAVDVHTSAALVGVEHEIVPGSERLFLNMVLRRLPEWGRANWQAHWIDHHAAEVRENVSGLQGYRQFHADEGASMAAAKSAGLAIHDYEGTAEGYYSDIDKFLETLSDPEVQKDTGFIDHGRSVMWLYALQNSN